MLIVDYPSKKTLRECIGQPLSFTETSRFGLEYRANGTFTGSNSPHLTGHKREFFATITMANGLIVKVE